MPINDDSKLQKIVSRLASKPGHENVRAFLRDLLTQGLDVDPNSIDLEKSLKEIRGRMDALLGRTIIEIKSDLQRELKEAENQLLKYIQEKEAGGDSYIGIATDGSVFKVYIRKNQGTDKSSDTLEAINEYKTDPSKSRELLIWLESALVLNDKLLPEGNIIEMELGKQSVFYQRSRKEIKRLWEELRNDSEAQTKYSIWKRLLNTAYGSEVEEKGLFLQHTYLTFVAKAIATVALLKSDLPDNAVAFLSGEKFSANNVQGAIESDFFDWVLSHKDGNGLVMDILQHIKRFRWEEIKTDILKILYESLIDPEERHELGEYYTPDWLAEKICRKVITNPLNMRIIDPACGSGTFLFHAIRLGLEKARENKVPVNQAAEIMAKNVSGIDVHPIAVIFARVTYLLALLPALQDAGKVNIDMPVYMGDSLQWSLRELLGKEDLEIYVPAEKDFHPYLVHTDSNGNGKNGKKDVYLKFPSEVAEFSDVFDEILQRMLTLAGIEEPVASFKKWLSTEIDVSNESKKALAKTYEDLCFLQKERRDHIWGYVARNLSRPIWLSSDEQKADVVIGNPPWVRYSNMAGTLKERFKAEMKKTEIWVGGKVATSQDLSSYFFVKSAELYMKESGVIAFILPYAAMSRQPYKKFRSGRYLNKKHSARYFQFTEAFALPAEVQPLFPVPACVLFAKTAYVTKPLPTKTTYFSGDLPRRDANLSEAESALTTVQSSWPADDASIEISIYANAFRQGAILAPRRLVFVERIPNPMAPKTISNNVEGRTGKLDKEPWKNIPPPQSRVEEEFIYPTYLGESIAPYRIIQASEAVIPWEREGEAHLMISQEAIKYKHLFNWLNKVEKIWEKNKPDNSSFLERINHQKALSAQFPIPKLRVVYATSGSQPAATILRDKNGIVDTTLYWIKPDNLDEAYYLVAILNSETTRAAAESWQAEGQWGKRHFHKVMFNLPIPKFDNKNALHQKLASAAKKAEKVAGKIKTKEGEYFTRFRKRIRNALIEDGIAGEIDKLVAQLLGLKA